MAKYNGSVELISGITQKNGQNFPLVDASAVQVNDEDKRLSEVLAENEEKELVMNRALGVTPVSQRVTSYNSRLKDSGTFSEVTGILDMKITSDLGLAGDCGFSFYLGHASELAGKKLILYKNEWAPFTMLALNVSHSWGGQTFANVERLFQPLSDSYWIADFDAVLAHVIEVRELDMETIGDDIYLMIYNNADWELPPEGEERHNYYAVYANLNDSVVVTPGILSMMAEIQDARLSSKGNAYPSVGDAIRHIDRYLETASKIPMESCRRSAGGEPGTGGTMTITSVMNDGDPVAHDVLLDYQSDEDQNYHIIRSAFRLPLTLFDERYKGKRIAFQVWASRDIDIYWGSGYVDVYRSGNTTSAWQHLHAGYNEYILDTTSEAFTGLTRPDGTGYFYINFLFGSFGPQEEPENGEYSFSMSFYCVEDVMKELVTAPYASGSGFAGSASYAITAGAAENATEASHAENASLAEKASVSASVGAVPVIQRVGGATGVNGYTPTLSSGGIVDLTINSEAQLRTDYGFTVYIGREEELRGKKLIFYRNEALPIASIALNAGHAWGFPTYADIQSLLTVYSDQYWIGDFDELFNHVVEARNLDLDEFDGNVFIMFYNNIDWELPAEGLEQHNYYAIYTPIKDGLIYNRQINEIRSKMDELSRRVGDYEPETVAELVDRCNELASTVEMLKAGNVLWGKKYFATGDSYTEGDFSSWTDENGLAGKNSPVIYDSEWRMYKTYPWWIAKRNNMTLINDGKCGSIMPLSKQYVAGEEGYAENYRQPFSLNRYRTIPADVDYITLWFGINDSSQTNLGTINDATNETYYGAWNVVMEYLITNYPYAKIGIIITDGAAAAYRQATREIAIKWGIPYLDMMGSDQTPVIFGRESELGLCGTANTLRRNAFLVGPSNGHPNLEAHRYQSTFVEDFLRRL